MNRKKFWFAAVGLPLLAMGFLLQNLEPYRHAQAVSGEASCRMRVDVVEPLGGTPQGYAVLFHGVAANKRIMSYITQDLANQNLRVFAPDFPGHGGSPAPFWPMRASECGEAFVRELIAKHAIAPELTILAGHSMGGAVALRVSAKVPVAGVIAISPAPMRTGRLLSKEMVFFSDDPPLAKNSLIVTGSAEPLQLSELAQTKIAEAKDPSNTYVKIPHASHVSILFDNDLLAEMREWNKKVLGTDPDVIRASHRPLYGFLCGMIALILLCVPFIAEVSGTADSTQADGGTPISATKVLGQLLVSSALVVGILKFWVPLKFLGIFQGEYLASFALLLGALLLAWNADALKKAWKCSWKNILGVIFGGIVLVLVFGLWFSYSFYEAFLNGPRWARMLPMIVAFFPWLLAEEIFLGAHSAMSRVRRVILTLAFRSIAWGTLAAAVFLLHSGEVLMILLVAYFVLVTLLLRLAADVVRRETQSAPAAALFGAILTAGFALAIFPLA
ncbi:MAG TPA: alpha/beta fold hydrolase [Candidatus Acidoferrum sp.]|nr:alpha/beta fold hydrolase [Candidatus Acidoferrum sp.]